MKFKMYLSTMALFLSYRRLDNYLMCLLFIITANNAVTSHFYITDLQLCISKDLKD